MITAIKDELAINGGAKAVTREGTDAFHWPIITDEDEAAVLAVLRRGGMSGTDVTELFEKEFAAWQGCSYALGCNNGTAALHSAMWACGVTHGTEIIAPAVTYWATALPALNLGASINFADIDPNTFCIDTNDIEHRINSNTRAIVVVHLYGHPVDMDPIMALAKKYNLKVIEDVSHAHGALYKGRKVGTIGDVGAMSMMSGKCFAIGEGGMLVTNNRRIYERAISFGHYERTGASRYSNAARAITDDSLLPYAGLPMGGFKYRMHQLSSAVGRVQLKHYNERMKDIQNAMNYFLDRIKDVPGIIDHRVRYERSTMGGWYLPAAGYCADDLGGLSVEKFCAALAAENVKGIAPGVNKALHTHALFHSADIYGDGKPTMCANTDRDIRQGAGTLPVAENIGARAMFIPWFKKRDTTVIDQYVSAFKKVASNYRALL